VVLDAERLQAKARAMMMDRTMDALRAAVHRSAAALTAWSLDLAAAGQAASTRGRRTVARCRIAKRKTLTVSSPCPSLAAGAG
jgi:hypothetical protein